LHDPKALEAKIEELFTQYAGADRKLNKDEMNGLALSLAAQLGVSTSAFGDITSLFYQCDFSGDGHLDLQEATVLVKHMLRQYRDAQASASKLKGVKQFTAAEIPSKQLDRNYALGKKLGQGGQGAVYLATNSSTGQQRVVKFYDKSCANAPVEDIVEEFKLLTSLDHPKIARLYEVFQDYAYIYVVSEPYFGGDLTTCAQKANEHGVKLSQLWLAGILQQICAGVGYLHGKKCMHCDLKEPNVMISGDNDWQNPSVVVIDFGLARDFKVSTGVMGTPGYMPPEVWQTGLWTPKGDVYSLGVVFYNLYCLHHRRAITGTTIEELQANTIENRIDFQPLSNCAPFQRMVQSMLAADFKSRPSVLEVTKRSWWSEAGKDGSASISTEAVAQLRTGRRRSVLQTALIMDVVSNQNLAHLRELNDLFASMDADNSGTVTELEARQALNGKLPPDQIDRLIQSLLGASGSVTYSRFMAEMIAAKKAEDGQLLWKLFKELDTDGNGTLNHSEIQAMMEKPAVKELLGSRPAGEIIRKMDRDGDGNVNFWEFKQALETPDTQSATTGGFMQGDKVQYFSASYDMWMDTKVTAVDAGGQIQLECKPGYWMPTAEQTQKVRRC